MPIAIRVAVFNKFLRMNAFVFGALLITPVCANAASAFHLEKDAQGQIRPFKAVDLPLPDFIREYSRLTRTPISTGRSLDQEMNGKVTVFMRHALKPEELTELFHRVLADNNYAVLEAPAGNGLVLLAARNARDESLPVYEATKAPNSARTITAYRNLKYIDSEVVARMLRSFMPANSRIIPNISQILITDTASNIRRLNTLIDRMDTPEGAQRAKDAFDSRAQEPKGCGEQKIEKLVVESLEIQNASGGNPLSPQSGAAQKSAGSQPHHHGDKR